MRRRNRGFTLVELMVILMLVAMILGLVIPSFRRSRDRAALEGCKQNLKTLSVAMQNYQVDNQGKFPNETGTFGTTTTESLTAATGVGQKLRPYVSLNDVLCPAKKGYSTFQYGYSISTGVSWMVYCDDSAPFTAGSHLAIGSPARYPRLTNTEMREAP